MSNEAAAKHFEKLAAELAGAYTLVISLLARLPIPMLLPQDQSADPVLAINALARAWELAYQEPVTKLAAGRVRDMITAWLTAYELAVAVTEHGPARWRLRGIEDALLRISARAYYIERYLTEIGK